MFRIYELHRVQCVSLPSWPLLPSIIYYHVSVWTTRLNCLKYVSLLWDKLCHQSIEWIEEVTLWWTATFPERVVQCWRSETSWSSLSRHCFDDGKKSNTLINWFCWCDLFLIIKKNSTIQSNCKGRVFSSHKKTEMCSTVEAKTECNWLQHCFLSLLQRKEIVSDQRPEGPGPRDDWTGGNG